MLSGRSELGEYRQKEAGYVVPNAEKLARHHFAVMDEALMHQLLPRYGGNPLAFFKAFLTVEIPEVKQSILDQLEVLPDELEVILSWSNCPSLAAAAGERGIKVVYVEVGPLREPHYRSTAYFDFRGVNGNTEGADRYRSSSFFRDDYLKVDDLRRAFSRRCGDQAASGDYVGVVLQVEDDSNLVCFNNGYDNIGLIVKALLEAPQDRVLIRAHPASRFEVRDGRMRDTSPTPTDFLRLCRKLICINSSLGLEGLLLGMPVDIHGDASYGFVLEEVDPIERLRRLSFYLFAYLAPFELIFSARYIRFRLQQPTEPEIVMTHLAGYGIDPQDVTASGSGFRELLLRMCEESSSENLDSERAADTLGVSTLHYRNGRQTYADAPLIKSANAEEGGGGLRVRFLLPEGERPDFVRFRPPRRSGCHVVSAMRWGWLVGSQEVELAPLFDMNIRLVASSGTQYVDDGSVVVITEDADADAWFELSVNDLWSSVSAPSGDGGGVLEFVFSHRSLNAETAYAMSRIRERVFGSQNNPIAVFGERELLEHQTLLANDERMLTLLIGLPEELRRQLEASRAELEQVRVEVAVAQDVLSVEQANQAQQLGVLAMRLADIQSAQKECAVHRVEERIYLRGVKAALDELRQISLMSWWQKRLARRTRTGET